MELATNDDALHGVARRVLWMALSLLGEQLAGPGIQISPTSRRQTYAKARHLSWVFVDLARAADMRAGESAGIASTCCERATRQRSGVQNRSVLVTENDH